VPVLNLKDSEVHAMALELAQLTGKSMTQVVKEALRERLAETKAAHEDRRRLLRRVKELAREISSRPVLDPRTPNEILGYDDIGVPR